MMKDFASQPVRFYAVNVDPDATTEAERHHAKEYGLTLPVLLDSKHQLVAATLVTHTPEAAVILNDGTIAYRGRIDDRYPGLGKKRQAPTQRDLRDALSAVLAGKPVRVPRTKAVGLRDSGLELGGVTRSKCNHEKVVNVACRSGSTGRRGRGRRYSDVVMAERRDPRPDT